MAGPGESIAAVLTCTKIYAGDLADQVLDRQKTPEWQGECTKLVYAFPTAEKLWDEYARVRAEGLRQGKGLAPATEFYAARREAMDAGAVVAWPQRFDPKTELSAVQHAMNLKLRDEEAFAAEYQNEPVVEQFADDRLTADEVAEKITGRPRGEVPLAATRVTAFIDVHDKLLFWCVCAWEEDFTGYYLDYGTFPDQRRLYFTLRDATHTLAATFRGAGREGAVQAGLDKLAGELLGRPWERTDGAALHVERMLIDSGYLPAVANAVAVSGVGGLTTVRSGAASGRTNALSTTMACTSCWARFAIPEARMLPEKTIGKPYAGNPHARIERELQETERRRYRA